MEEKTLWQWGVEFINSKTDSEPTRKTYRTVLINYLGWLHENECFGIRKPDISDMNEETVIAFRESELSRVSAKTGKPIAATSVRLSIACLKSFDTYLSKKLKRDRMLEDVTLPQGTPAPRYALQQGERDCLKEFVRLPHNTYEGLREATLVLFHYRFGLRASEPLRITPAQLNFNTHRVMDVLCKGGKRQNKPIAEAHEKFLKRFLGYRSEYMRREFKKRGDCWDSLSDAQKDSYPLIASAHSAKVGEPNTWRRGDSTVRAMYRKWGKQLETRLHAHRLRHTYADDVLLASNFDVALLQKCLGHATPTMSMHYAQRSDEQLEKIQEKLAA